MAFWKYKSYSEKVTCEVCRKKYNKGVTVSYQQYGIHMCSECFKRDYKSKGNNVVFFDNNKNIITQFRLSPVLERPLYIFENTQINKARNRKLGYEFCIPEVTSPKIFSNVINWCVLLFILHRITFVGGNSIGNLSDYAVSGVMVLFLQLIVSSIWAVLNACKLIKGVFLGMGYFRRFVLLITILILSSLIILSVEELQKVLLCLE